MTASSTTRTKEDLLHEIALEAVRRRLRPIADRDGALAAELFRLEDRIQDRRRALHLLRSSFDGTDPARVGPGDARIYERELARRERQRARLEQERDRLLPEYALLLIEARPRHPALQELFAELDRSRG